MDTVQILEPYTPNIHAPPVEDIPGLIGGSSGSGSGSLALLSGSGPPSADPGVDVAIYIDEGNGTQYDWYSGAWH